MNQPRHDTPPIGPPVTIPRRLTILLWIFVLAGVVTVLVAVAGFASERIWMAYLINFCFWTGLAQAGVVFSAAYRMTNGTWGETIRRVGEGFVLFVPLSVVLFLVTYAGRHYLWPWIDDPIPAKEAWLNETFFFARVTAYFLILSVISLRYVYVSVRPEVGFMKERGLAPESPWVNRLTRGWKGWESEREVRSGRLKVLVPLLLIAYAGLYSFVGFDVVMSLDPHWYSTLYGWLYFVHAFNAGVAGTIIVAILARKYFNLGDHVSTQQFYDVSRLLMGICMLAGGFYWSQYLVIWYGNLGEEIERLIVRFRHDPWPPYQWTVIAGLYFFPIVVFLSRAVKERPRILLVIASVILSANWLYHFVEIAPAIWFSENVPLGLPELTLALGFGGLLGLSWLACARIVPLVGSYAGEKPERH
ncbi:MAG: hypothetical protein WD295_03515 [Bacteroidota bacterium]